MTAGTGGGASPRDRLALARDPGTGLEAVAARFHAHAYDLHEHDEWLVGITHAGVQDFFCRGARRQSTPGRVILIEPGERHDGQAVREGGFFYSMLYLPQQAVRDRMGGDGHLGFRDTLADDPLLFRAVQTARDAVFLGAPRLGVEAARDGVLDRLSRHLGAPPPPRASLPGDRIAERAMEALRAQFDQEIGADALARSSGAADRFALARAFRARWGVAPHAAQVQMRLAEARRMLRAQVPPAETAAACGFADQSHMGRWFRRAYGLSPAVWRRGRTGVPDFA